MALAKQEREMAARGEGCLGKAADDEPVFVLRARDLFAPQMVRNWAASVTLAELTEMLVRAEPDDEFDAVLNKGRLDKIQEALQLAHDMERWQGQNGSKIPD